MTRSKLLVLLTVLGAGLVMSLGATIMLANARTRAASEGSIVVVQGTPSPGTVTVRDIEESPDGSGLPHLFDAPGFDLLDPDGKPISTASLAGRPYIAAFMFTHCTTACPMMAGRMVSLQERIKERALRFVSFSVDPTRDTPEVLKSYLTRFKADPARWIFLTGTKDQMEAAETGFHLRLPRPDPNAVTPETAVADPMALRPHSDRFLLVDGKGRVRGIYDSKDDTAMDKLTADVSRLMQQSR